MAFCLKLHYNLTSSFQVAGHFHTQNIRNSSESQLSL